MKLILLLISLAGALPEAAEARSQSVARQFQRDHPCPSTGQHYGGCPGYIRDHIIPLCAGGADAPWNMQWQTTAEARAKDKLERRQCRR